MQYHLIEDWMTIKISRDVEKRITISFPYNHDYIAKIKTMQGYIKGKNANKSEKTI